jgi:hypothetical protein
VELGFSWYAGGCGGDNLPCDVISCAVLHLEEL